MKSFRLEFFLLPVMSIILGVYLISHPWAATTAICRFIGWLVLLGGIGAVCSGVMNRAAGTMAPFLVVGILAILVGAYFIQRPWAIVTFVNLAICVLLLAEGAGNVQNAFMRRDFGDSLWWVMLVVGAVCIALGLYAIFSPWATNTMMRVIGVMMLVSGFSGLVGAARG